MIINYKDWYIKIWRDKEYNIVRYNLSKDESEWDGWVESGTVRDELKRVKKNIDCGLYDDFSSLNDQIDD